MGKQEGSSSVHGAMERWLELASRLKLNQSEKNLLKRLESDPNGRGFLPLFELFANHKRSDEALEILADGVARHPDYSAARVVLARELFKKGMVEESWETLEYDPSQIRDNALAQKLVLKLAILRRDSEQAFHTANLIDARGMADNESKRYIDLLKNSHFDLAVKELLSQLHNQGISPRWLGTPTERKSQDSGDSKNFLPLSGDFSFSSEDVNGTYTGGTEAKTPSLSLALSRIAGKAWKDSNLAGFYVVELHEIFQPGEGGGLRISGAINDPFELDSSTLAEIYAEQGHYGRAFDVYKRMLRVSPGNELLKRKASEMLRLKKEQNQHDAEIDPTIFEKLESLEIVDSQIRFYNDLLARVE